MNTQPGVLGTLSIGGHPDHYTLRVGLTGEVLGEGDAEAIIAALARELRNPDGSEVRFSLLPNDWGQ